MLKLAFGSYVLNDEDNDSGHTSNNDDDDDDDDGDHIANGATADDE